jgi:hypothetical protein
MSFLSMKHKKFVPCPYAIITKSFDYNPSLSLVAKIREIWFLLKSKEQGNTKTKEKKEIIFWSSRSCGL